MEAPVFMYYRLHNFYQNHRKYVKSFDAKQLKGSFFSIFIVSIVSSLIGARLQADQLSNSCDKYRTVGQSKENITYTDGIKALDEAQFYPCGLIANSIFTDAFSNLACSDTETNCGEWLLIIL